MSQDVRSPGWQVGESRLVARGGIRRWEAGGALPFSSSWRGRRGGCGHRAVASRGEPRLTLHLLCLQLTPCLLCCLQLTMAKRLQARRLDGIDHNPW